jgi:hypothetical protein
MRKFLTLLIAILTLSFSSQAQKSLGKVSGQVIDGNTKTVEAATITLLRAKDSSVAKISAANKNGNFVFENVIEGNTSFQLLLLVIPKGFQSYLRSLQQIQMLLLRLSNLFLLQKILQG